MKNTLTPSVGICRLLVRPLKIYSSKKLATKPKLSDTVGLKGVAFEENYAFLLIFSITKSQLCVAAVTKTVLQSKAKPNLSFS